MPAPDRESNPHEVQKVKAANKKITSSPHKLGDPVGRGVQKGGIGLGGLLVGGVGCLFVAYVWNVGGLHVTLDDLFSGWNQNVHGHNDEVARWYLAALPLIGMALAVVVVYWMLSSLVGGVTKAHKRRKKRKQTPAKAKASGAAVTAAASAAKSMEFVRPIRPVGARDGSVLVKTQS